MESPMESSTGPFSINEKVLCFHGTLLYEGKILTAEHDQTNNIWSYKVHYKGWNKKWDEKILENRIMKYNAENVARQEDHNRVMAVKQNKEKPVKKSTGSRKSKSTGGSSTSKAPSDEPERPKKLAKAVELETVYLGTQDIQINIPNELKMDLIRDWDQVVGHKDLHKVPAEITVESLLNDYVKAREIPGSLNLEEDFVLGIKEYFNTMLPNSLLYNNEKQQCNELKKQLPKLSNEPKHLIFNFASVYGPVFLLRLFTRLGSCLAISMSDKEDLDGILRHTSDLMDFILQNRGNYFPQAQEQDENQMP